eukprot:SAG22_NODE_1550_length_4145_cov_149.312654_2_plen_176_part_00
MHGTGNQTLPCKQKQTGIEKYGTSTGTHVPVRTGAWVLVLLYQKYYWQHKNVIPVDIQYIQTWQIRHPTIRHTTIRHTTEYMNDRTSTGPYVSGSRPRVRRPPHAPIHVFGAPQLVLDCVATVGLALLHEAGLPHLTSLPAALVLNLFVVREQAREERAGPPTTIVVAGSARPAG